MHTFWLLQVVLLRICLCLLVNEYLYMHTYVHVCVVVCVCVCVCVLVVVGCMEERNYWVTVVPIILPLAKQESSGCSMSLPVFEIIFPSRYPHSGGYEAVVYCGLNFHCRDIGYWVTSFVKRLFGSFAPFSIGLPIFFLLVCRKVLRCG